MVRSRPLRGLWPYKAKEEQPLTVAPQATPAPPCLWPSRPFPCPLPCPLTSAFANPLVLRQPRLAHRAALFRPSLGWPCR